MTSNIQYVISTRLNASGTRMHARTWLVRPLLLAGVVLVLIPARGLAAESVPAWIAHKYASTPNPLVSDEFNNPTLDTTKWGYRLRNGADWGSGTDYVDIFSDGSAQYVAIDGDWSEGKGSGLSSKTAAHFGFYTTRWRTENIILNEPTPWHPAIWMAVGQNLSSGSDHRTLPSDGKRLEIDLVEYEWNPEWHAQTITWETVGPNSHIKTQQRLLDGNDFGSASTGWKTHGIEYHPDYIQLWELMDGSWTPRGRRIPVTDEPLSSTNINREYTDQGFWILSNNHFWDELQEYPNIPDASEFRLEDSSLHVDYFRYFPLADGFEGDFNNDGSVGIADYAVWRDQLGAAEDDLVLGGNGDGGIVGPSDYQLWKSNFGRTIPMQPALVAQWNMDPDDVDPYPATASDPNLAFVPALSNQEAVGGISASGDDFFARANLVSDTLIGAIADEDFVSFTISPEGNQLDLSHLGWDWTANTSIDNGEWFSVHLFSSVDGFDAEDVIATSTNSRSETGALTLGLQLFDLNSSRFQNLNGATEFRLYFTSNADVGGDLLRLDNLSLYGHFTSTLASVSTVPEPSSNSLTQWSALMMLGWALRSRLSAWLLS